jgi:hypothetical protein
MPQYALKKTQLFSIVGVGGGSKIFIFWTPMHEGVGESMAKHSQPHELGVDKSSLIKWR